LGQKSVRLVGGNTVYNTTASGFLIWNSNYQGGGGAVASRINSSALTVASSSNTGLNIQSDSGICLFYSDSSGFVSRNTYDGAVQTQNQGYLSEIIGYFSDQSTSRSGITTNINNYYNVY
jgi:hypothetical protein